MLRSLFLVCVRMCSTFIIPQHDAFISSSAQYIPKPRSLHSAHVAMLFFLPLMCLLNRLITSPPSVLLCSLLLCHVICHRLCIFDSSRHFRSFVGFIFWAEDFNGTRYV